MRRPSSACQHQLRGHSTRPRRLRLRCQRSAASAAGKGSGWQAVGRRWQVVAGSGRRWQAVVAVPQRASATTVESPLAILMHGTTFHRNRFLRDECTTTCITGRPARNSADNLGHVTSFTCSFCCHWPAIGLHDSAQQLACMISLRPAHLNFIHDSARLTPLHLATLLLSCCSQRLAFIMYRRDCRDLNSTHDSPADSQHHAQSSFALSPISPHSITRSIN